MPFIARDPIFAALYKLMQDAAVPKQLGSKWRTTSRDIPYDFENYPAANQPALFVSIHPAQQAFQDPYGLTRWKLKAEILVMYRADSLSNPALARDTVANEFMDVIESTIDPSPGELQTLGGLVHHTYIEGTPVIASGQVGDPQGIIWVPITMDIGALGT